ncbi:unnamed protein product [Dibothriocephalus latus]|uniref:Glycoside hydrolase family 5 domain-containing protein n=1 Tax=Dibothriocephalus latus TaxID=60516 RepID=A0A3P6TK59_DIBLA|nr:unnamed protein product [Dibothriocephalus latus]
MLDLLMLTGADSGPLNSLKTESSCTLQSVLQEKTAVSPSFVSGYAGKHNILPVFDYLVKRIRAVDREKFIFFESVTWSVLGTQSYGGIFGAGFDHVPGALEDPTEPTRSVLSYHYYCPLTQLSNPADDFPNWKRVLCDEVTFCFWFSAFWQQMSVKLCR